MCRLTCKTGSVTVSPQTLGLLLGHMYCSPQNKGLVAELCQCPRQAIELFAQPIQTAFRSLCMQLDNCFIRLYNNVTGQANHLQYHQDGNRQYTRVLVKVSPSNEIMSVVCFRQLGRPNSEFRISQPSGTYYVIRYE